MEKISVFVIGSSFFNYSHYTHNPRRKSQDFLIEIITKGQV